MPSIIMNSTYGIIPVSGTSFLSNSTCTSTCFIPGIIQPQNWYYVTGNTATSVYTNTTSNTIISSAITDINNRMYLYDNAVILTDDQRAYQEKQRRDYLRKRQEKIQRAKSAIKRSLKLIDNIGFGNDIRIFLKGDSIEVSHPNSLFKFLLHKRSYDTIINSTIQPGRSTPYVLELYTKTDVFVASLCVYLEDTPILDQVMAVAMFIKSGDEDIILKQANWYKLTNDEDTIIDIAVRYPELENKLRLERFGSFEIENNVLH